MCGPEEQRGQIGKATLKRSRLCLQVVDSKIMGYLNSTLAEIHLWVPKRDVGKQDLPRKEDISPHKVPSSCGRFLPENGNLAVFSSISCLGPEEKKSPTGGCL